jgi:VCBS repeat-containing protein
MRLNIRSSRRLVVIVALLAGLMAPTPALAVGPTASPQTLRTPVSTDLPMVLTAHDPQGSPGHVLTFLTTLPAHGTVLPPAGAMTCPGSGKSCSVTVTYTPEAGYRGPDSFDFTVTDDDVPPETSPPATVSITVNDLPVAINDADAGCEAGGRYLATEDTQLVVPDGGCDVVANDNDFDGDPMTAVLATDVTMGTLSLAPDGSFTYDPDPDAWSAAGTTTDSFTYQASDGFELSSPATVLINVAGVNDDPAFTKGLDQSVDEDAGSRSVPGWATGISSGPNETDVLTFVVTNNDNPGLLSAGPAVAANGTLTYTPTANASGTATITLRLDDGAGGTTPTQSFSITVDPVNDAPTYMKGPNQSVAEDSGATTVPGWATNMSAGPADEVGQNLTFSVAGNTAPSLFSAGPAVAANGTLSYTVAVNATGTSTITLRLSDDGGTANGGVDHSDQTFTITVGAVNDPPTFTKGANKTVNEDEPAQAFASWATAISPGDPTESGQILTFLVTGNTNSALFAVQPAVASNGMLTFTPAANRNGTTTISLVLKDNGGTANGGADTSATATFTITITTVNDAPNAANDVGLEVRQNTPTSLPVLANDTTLPDSGETLTIVAVSAASHGTVAITGGGTGVRYTPATTYRGSDSFTYTVSDGAKTDSATVLLTVVQAGTVTRLAGANRYATSAAISKASFSPGVPVAYIATGTGFADALSGAPVAGIAGGPILLVPGTSIPSVIATELGRLKPARIVILGGTGVVSAGVATALSFYTTGP